MLRRKPTALTISPEDLSAFDELYGRQVAYRRWRKTGEDPNGWFRNERRPPPRSQSCSQTDGASERSGHSRRQYGRDQQFQRPRFDEQSNRATRGADSRTGIAIGTGTGTGTGELGLVDPNDELKPLPGDKARIVRSREERIVGPSHVVGAGAGAGAGTSGAGMAQGMGVASSSAAVAVAGGLMRGAGAGSGAGAGVGAGR